MHRREEKRREETEQTRRDDRQEQQIGLLALVEMEIGLKEGAFFVVVVVGEVVEEVTKLLRKEAGGDGVGVFDGCDPDAFCFF
jgi:hypothetical protein